jgi:hypothetical protein
MTRLFAALLLLAGPADPVLQGRVVDADSGKPLACRISIRGTAGTCHFAKSVEGSTVEYFKQAGQNKASIERHVTLSAHPFKAELPPGTYTLTVQHGKEYLPETRTIELGAGGAEAVFKLRRWIDMASRGWYSGETHVHRMPDQLPNVQLAEDLNVALPLTSWVTESHTSPGSANKAGAAVMNDARVVEIDPTHVFYPRNTEYEIFRVGKKSHTLGALFILNHKTLFEEGVPPLKPIVDKARAEGALLELDKHNWPWSMMLAPVFKVDLYELANNHLWETEFAFRDFGSAAPAYMGVEKDEKGMTERGWIDYGFQNYYALLNCGLKMRPTAGSASGVHPVPLGFGRVYVRLDGPFSYDAWMKGLNEGRSFVTTGPMLFASLAKDNSVDIVTESAYPIDYVEIVVNGTPKRAAPTALPNEKTPQQGFRNAVNVETGIRESSWVAVRCFEKRPDGRPRWAHSAPLCVDVPGKPLRPKRIEVEYLLKRVQEELARNSEVLAPDALAEYKEAMDFYRSKLEESR